MSTSEPSEPVQDPSRSAAAAEAILFVCAEPITEAVLARALQCTEAEAREAVHHLAARLDATGSGIQVLAYREAVGRMMTREPGKLSRAALETLAVIAYRQPVTQPEIEAIRGVGCSSVLRTLMERNLIAEAGRKPTVGRPICYTTTQSFLHYFALADLSELPPLEDLSGEAAEVIEV